MTSATEHGLRTDALTRGDYLSLTVAAPPPPLRGTRTPGTVFEDPDAWRTRAACRGWPTSWWFPDQGEPVPDQARAICASCPVRAQCLTAHLSEPDGYWGGMTYRQRREERRRRGGAPSKTDLNRDRVAHWADRGLTDEQIAATLKLSVHWVRQLRRQTGRKRGAAA